MRVLARRFYNFKGGLTPATGTLRLVQQPGSENRCLSAFVNALVALRSTWLNRPERPLVQGSDFVASFGTLQGRSKCHRELLERARDRLSELALEPTIRAAAARSLCAALRRLGHVIAHQFEMGLAAHAANPRPRLASLQGCTVTMVSRKTASAMIRRFEWLGTIGRARLFYGLQAPNGDLLGVVGFGPGAHDAGRCGALVLERGCVQPHAPPNAASHLIGRAIRTLRQMGWRRFKAYSDPAAGETGAVYKAAGFRRCAPTKHGSWPWRYALLIGGKTLSDRDIRRRFGTFAGARAAGGTIIKVPARIAWERA